MKKQTELSTGNVDMERGHVTGVITDFKVPLFPCLVVESPKEQFVAWSVQKLKGTISTCFLTGQLNILSAWLGSKAAMMDSCGALFAVCIMWYSISPDGGAKSAVDLFPPFSSVCSTKIIIKIELNVSDFDSMMYDEFSEKLSCCVPISKI